MRREHWRGTVIESALKILLVDDEPEDVWALQQVITESGSSHFQLTPVNGIDEARAVLGKERFEAVLMDLTLPDRQGLEALALMQNMAPSAPIIVLADPPDEGLALKAVQAGAQDYLVKGHMSGELLMRSIRYGIERHRLLTELRAASLIDELTGLHNRVGFLKLANQQLKIANRTKRAMHLILVDIKSMNWINERFGSYQGDLTLSETATVLKKTFRGSDIIGRVGGDEFAILVLETTGVNPELFVNRLNENLRAYNSRDSRPYKLSFLVGLSQFDPHNPCTIEDLLKSTEDRIHEQKAAEPKA